MNKPFVVTLDMLDQASYKSRCKWTLAQLQLVVTKYLAGSSALELGIELERGEDTIIRVLKIMGVTIRKRGRAPALTPEQKKLAAEMLKTKTQQQVANFFGVGRFPIQRIDAEEKRKNAKLQVH